MTLRGKAGDEGKLFGSITSQDIAAALAAQGFTVDKRKLELEHPIKTVGFHSVIGAAAVGCSRRGEGQHRPGIGR